MKADEKQTDVMLPTLRCQCHHACDFLRCYHLIADEDVRNAASHHRLCLSDLFAHVQQQQQMFFT
jgi:hypothetical protein